MKKWHVAFLSLVLGVVAIHSAQSQARPGSGVTGNGRSAAGNRGGVAKGTAGPAPEMIKLPITKSTGDTVIPGTYTFNLLCHGPGGTYTPAPVTITLPGSGTSTAAVPQGDTCSITEVQPSGSWNPPTWTGGGVTPAPSSGWTTNVGPLNQGSSLKVTNTQKKSDLVDLPITKSTGDTVIPGTYYFNIACTGPGGPYSTLYPEQIVLPGTGTYVAHVPAGDTCTVTEGQLDQAVWNAPTWSGNGVTATSNPWAGRVGPVQPGSAITATNHRKPPQLTKLQITKSTGSAVVAGTYTFNIACSGPGGPYTGINPLTITLPGNGIKGTAVPQGDTCTLTEQQPAGTWSAPTWSGAGWTPNGWSATATIGGSTLSVTATNHKVTQVTKVQVAKTFDDGQMVAGSYHFSISCTGPGGPYSNTATITLPGQMSLDFNSVPVGDSCTVTENQLGLSAWDTPTWMYSSSTVNAWQATVTTTSSPSVLVVTNHKKVNSVPVPLKITKTMTTLVPGTYKFAISCSGPGGPYTGTNPVQIVLPGTGIATATVPSGDTCTLTETMTTTFTGDWVPPTWTGTGVTGSGWGALVGPISSSGAIVGVANHPWAKLYIDKYSAPISVPGTYYFDVACQGPGGPSTTSTPYPAIISASGPSWPLGDVPLGDTCTITEHHPAAGNWSAPTWSGTGVQVSGSPGWSTTAGPFTNASTHVAATNHPAAPPMVPLTIYKNTGSMQYTGTFNFTIDCTGSGGVFTHNAVSINFPASNSATVQVPSGYSCKVAETPITDWGAPVWSNGWTASGWSATKTITAAQSVTARNVPPPAQMVPLTIQKTTGATVIPGTYTFHVSCSDVNGGPSVNFNPVVITLPGSGTGTVNVPLHELCMITEDQPASGIWNQPNWGGQNGLNPTVNFGWQVGVVMHNAGTIQVSNSQQAPATGSYEITKAFDNPGGQDVNFNFRLSLSCTGQGGPFNTAAANIPWSTWQGSISIPYGGLPVGDQCTFTEDSTGLAGWGTPTWQWCTASGCNNLGAPTIGWSTTFTVTTAAANSPLHKLRLTNHAPTSGGSGIKVAPGQNGAAPQPSVIRGTTHPEVTPGKAQPASAQNPCNQKQAKRGKKQRGSYGQANDATGCSDPQTKPPGAGKR